MNNKFRILSRELLLRVIYQQDINGYSFKDILKGFIEKRKYDEKHLNNIIDLIELNNTEINKFIKNNTDLELKKLTPIDRSIIRLSCCELLYREDIPAKVIINEGVNLAKKYSTDDSYKFVNIILDKLSAKAKHDD